MTSHTSHTLVGKDGFQLRGTPLWRVGGFGAGVGGGSGLGVLSVRRIVREHGGELAIESSEGKGMTLTIRLPFLDRRVRMLPDKKRMKDEG